MRDAALYLFWHSARNRLRGIRLRFRSPRYAVAMLLGVGYLGLIFFGQRHGSGGALPAPVVAASGTLFLVFLVAKWWIFGADRTALAFSPAEIHFLFPAPVSRAALVLHKVLKAQPLLIFNVLVWTVLLHRGAASPLGSARYALGLWLFFSILFLHRLGVALTRDSATGHGVAGLTRNAPALLLVVVAAVAGWITWHRPPTGGWTAGPDGPLGGIGSMLDAAPLRYVAWPFRIPVAPLTAGTMSAWLRAMLAAGAVLALHLLWVIRADRAFGEAALEASIRKAERLERWRRQGASATTAPRRTRFWFRLGASGHPITAIVWKNTTRLVRSMSPVFIATLGVITLGGTAFAAVSGAENPELFRVIGTIALTWVVLLALLGPQWVRIDLRGELEHLGVLRTWPLSGLVIMAGQVFASAIVLGGVQLLLGGVALAGLWSDVVRLLPGPQLAALILPAALIVLALSVVALCIQNGAALLFPAWVRTEIRPGGFEQVGQHLLTAGISLLLLLLAALGPAIAAAGTAYLLWTRLAGWALTPAALLAVAALALEAFLLLDWLGDRFERADPSTI